MFQAYSSPPGTQILSKCNIRIAERRMCLKCVLYGFSILCGTEIN